MPTDPPNNTEITPYDADTATGKIPSADFVDTPRADGNTCFAMALMLCLQPVRRHAVLGYHAEDLRQLFADHFPTGMAGGMGRKGSQKVIIFETDGLANCHGHRQPGERRELQVLQNTL